MGDGERIFVCKTDNNEYKNEFEITKKYQILWRLLPLKVIWVSVDKKTQKLRCCVIHGNDGWELRKIIMEINDSIDKIRL